MLLNSIEYFIEMNLFFKIFLFEILFWISLVVYNAEILFTSFISGEYYVLSVNLHWSFWKLFFFLYWGYNGDTSCFFCRGCIEN
jgi:hypothetical protein